jgi:hypothetical protein
MKTDSTRRETDAGMRRNRVAFASAIARTPSLGNDLPRLLKDLRSAV